MFNCKNAASGCTGNYNTALGFAAGLTSILANANVTGANNTFIGSNSGPGTLTQLDNATAIGANAVVSESNALVLGSVNGVNGATSSVNVGIGTSLPVAALDVHTFSQDVQIGDPGCGSAYSGFTFGRASTDCTGYSLIGNGTDTILNRQSGGTWFFGRPIQLK